MAHKTLVAGTAYEVSGGNTLLDATQREISKGRSLVGGTGYDIGFAQVIESVPSQSGSLTYSGSAQSPSWSNYDSSVMTIGGTTSATNAGTYTATFTPKSGFCWADGSTTAKNVSWTIGKAAGSVSLSKSSISLGAGSSTTFTVSRSGNGAISVKSSSTSKATASISGTTVTVKGVAAGSATITVTVAEGTNHKAASKTCKVTVNYTVKISANNDGPAVSIGGKMYSYYSGVYTNTISVEVNAGAVMICYAPYVTIDGEEIIVPIDEDTGSRYYYYTINSSIRVNLAAKYDPYTGYQLGYLIAIQTS